MPPRPPLTMLIVFADQRQSCNTSLDDISALLMGRFFYIVPLYFVHDCLKKIIFCQGFCLWIYKMSTLTCNVFIVTWSLIYLFIFIYLFIYLFIYGIYLLIYHFIYLFIYLLFIYLFTYLLLDLFTLYLLYIYLFTYLLLTLFIYFLFTFYLFIYLLLIYYFLLFRSA